MGKEPAVKYDDETLRRLQLVELEILKAVDAVCREHDIAYFLDSGTALGARRHCGFIPWDDDIDIGMPRDDYERFLKVAPAALGDVYAVVSPEGDERLAGLFAKVWKRGTKFHTKETEEAGVDQGIFIDVFPYDLVASDAAAAKKQLRSCLLWQSASYLYHSKAINVPHAGALGTAESLGCRAVHRIVHAAGSPAGIYGRFTAAATAAREDAAATSLACMNYTNSGVFPAETLLPPAPISFEGCEFFGPADIEGYLRIMFGDSWSELPPESERRNHAPKELDFGAQE